MTSSIISVENFSYSYRGSSNKALHAINFCVEKNECYGIIGPSEAGKTTLCYAIASVLPHYFSGGTIEGRITTQGLDAQSTSLDIMSEHVGFLMQNSSHYLTGIKPSVEEEIAFSMENRGTERETMLERIRSMMEELGISHLAGRNPHTLSGGEMQRVALASAMALDPAILILDEPTSGLDHAGISDLKALLTRMKGKKTILLVESRIETLVGLVDKVLVLREGKFVYDGPLEKFFADVRSVGEEIGPPIWTEIYNDVMERMGSHPASLPYRFKDAMKEFQRIL